MSVAIAVDAIAYHVDREELGLADLAMGGTLGGRAEVSPLHEGQGRVQLLGKVCGATAVVSEGGDGRQRVLVAQEAAEAGFHAPDGEKRAGRHPVAALDRSEELGIAGLHLLAA